jgi:hypothetical protein
MRTAFWLLLMSGCGGSSGFVPPPVASDELQVLSPKVTVPSGANLTLCSYLSTTIAETTDVISSRGLQSAGGHHAIVYVAKASQPANTHECTEADMVNVHYLAGIGADESANFNTLPDGLAFRIPGGSQLMIQTHWINATPRTLTGQAAINLKVAAPSTARVPADLFSVANLDFDIPAGQLGSSSTSCTVPQDVSLFFIAGHEHAAGTHFRIEQLDASSASTLLYDRDWLPEYEFNPPLHLFSKDQPLTIKTGQTVKVTCSWDNTAGATPLRFPVDMCVAWGFYFPGRGEIDCVNGVWPMN